jgi:hypothetical protein
MIGRNKSYSDALHYLIACDHDHEVIEIGERESIGVVRFVAGLYGMTFNNVLKDCVKLRQMEAASYPTLDIRGIGTKDPSAVLAKLSEGT